MEECYQLQSHILGYFRLAEKQPGMYYADFHYDIKSKYAYKNIYFILYNRYLLETIKFPIVSL